MSTNQNIEILSLEKNKCPYFVVDNTVNEVPISWDNAGRFYKADGKSVFSAGDISLVLSVLTRLPYMFCFGNSNTNSSNNFDNSVRFKIEVQEDGGSGQTGRFQNFTNGFTIPYANYEMSINSYSNSPPPYNYFLNCEFLLNGGGKVGTVSMVNVPNSLNGLIFNMNLFLKVSHTLDLVS